MIEYSGETLTGVIDGRNQTFGVNSSMGLGSCAVYLNGILLTPGLDTGWAQLDDVTVVLKEPPQFGDVVAVAYLSTTAAYKDAHLVPLAAAQATITPVKPFLQLTPLSLGGIAVQPISVGATVGAIQPPGLNVLNLTPELAPL